MKKELIFIWIGAGVVLALAIFLFLGKLSGNATKNCYNIEGKIVKGQSLSPIINDSQKIEIYEGYYNCHSVKKGEIIEYNLSIDPNPIIKIVKGVPGDSLSFSNVGPGKWEILVNGVVLKTSTGLPYEVGTQSYFALTKYAGSVIPLGHYLILGNLVAGSVDSRDFGLISKDKILGRVAGFDTNPSVIISGYVDALGLYSQMYIAFVTTCNTGWTVVHSGTNCLSDWVGAGSTGIKCAEPGSSLCATEKGGYIYPQSSANLGTPQGCTSGGYWVMCAK